MPLRFDDGAVGVANTDPVHQVVHVEDLILLSRYDEAAKASVTLVPRFFEGGKGTEALFQRALVASLQAHYFSGRQQDVENLVEELGLQRLAVPTFVAWILLLLESGQATGARQRVERYMAAVVSLLQGRAGQAPSLDPPAPAVACLQGNDIPSADIEPQSPIATAESRAARAELLTSGSHAPQPSCPEQESGLWPECRAGVGAAAATVQDREALARLYSQDVLGVGLRLPLEALRWLQPAPAPPMPQHQHQQPQRDWQGTDGGGGAKQVDGPVVEARELLGCSETVRRLREELEQLLLASGLMPPPAEPDRSPGNGGAGGSGTDTAPGGAVAPAKVAASATPTSGHGLLPQGANAATSANGVLGGSGHGNAAAPPPPPDSAWSTLAGATRRHAALLVPTGRLPALLSMLRAWLAAARAVAARLSSGAALQLTRAQTWVVCKAAAAAARLRALEDCNPGLGASFRRVATLVAVGAMVLVAMQAEAPHLGAALRSQWAELAGMVREALRMGMAMHPSPVATGAQAML